VHVPRHILLTSYYKKAPEGEACIPWGKWFSLGTVAAGLLWGAAAVFLFPEASLPHQFLLGVFVAGIAAGAAAVYWPLTLAYFPTILAELLPLSGRFIYLGDKVHIIVGAVIIMFAGILLLMARHSNAANSESLRLLFDNNRLVRSLESAQEELQKRVDERTAELTEANAELRLEINERRQAEAALRESEEKYRLLFETAQEAIFIAQDGKILFANPATEKISGYALQDLLYQPFFEFIHPTDRDTVKERHGRRLSGEDLVARYAIRIIGKGGITKWVEINSSPTSWEGRPAVLVSMMDFTDRKIAEDALRSSEARFRSIYDQAPVMMHSLDKAGIVRNVNNKWLSQLGYGRDEVLGRRLDFIIGPESKEIFPERFAEFWRNGHISDVRYQYLKKDGTFMEVLLDSVAMDDPIWGDVSLSVVRDVTEQDNLEKQLRQSQKMEAIATLAGGIAHDFNNLLTVILGFSELLIDERCGGPEWIEDLDRIRKAAQGGAELVKQILTFSRGTEIRLRPINLNDQIVHVQQILSRTIPKMIKVELRLRGDLSLANADPSQIEQVLMNLALNAKDAMPQGGNLIIQTDNVHLTPEFCRIHPTATCGDHVMLSVSDSGNGMDEETVRRIFDPFFTTKEPGKGSGLGLAMVYGIVKQHGGYIHCISAPGKGTSFEVYLPVSEVAVAAGDAQVAAEAERTSLAPAQGETVLIVDDEDDVRDLGKRILVRCGYRVLTAANGKEALDIYGREWPKIDVVILDLIMPEMGGEECLRNLKRINPEARVLISSGHTRGGAGDDGPDMKVRGFVHKPYEIKDMMKSVRDALNGGAA